MTQFNVHEAKTQFSRLIERAVSGEDVVIARAGKPLVKLVPVAAAKVPARRLGFLEGQFNVPDDIDAGFNDEIVEMFGV